MIRDLTVVLPHFANMGMLAEQQHVWAAYPDVLRSRLHVIVVDDCSPKAQRPSKKTITAVDGLASFRVYRLLQKKRWNWLACRNLGAQMATTERLLLTDIDHVLPPETLVDVFADRFRADSAYKFRRVTATGCWPYQVADLPPYKPHNDSWLVTRALFFDPRVGGYDERLSGCYGTSGEFSDRLRAAARAIVFSPHMLVRYPREIIADASTSPDVYTRKGDPENDKDLATRKAHRALIPEWKPLHGLIPYELVYEQKAEVFA